MFLPCQLMEWWISMFFTPWMLPKNISVRIEREGNVYTIVRTDNSVFHRRHYSTSAPVFQLRA